MLRNWLHGLLRMITLPASANSLPDLWHNRMSAGDRLRFVLRVDGAIDAAVDANAGQPDRIAQQVATAAQGAIPNIGAPTAIAKGLVYAEVYDQLAQIAARNSDPEAAKAALKSWYRGRLGIS